MNILEKTRPIPKAPDAAYLERAALYYLERFAASSAQFEQVLRRKIMRRCKARGESPEPYYVNIAPLVERYQACGLLDDVRFAQAKVASLRRKGASKRGITAKLRQKGLPADLIEEEIAENETSELEAAQKFVRRKKLSAGNEKALAAMARAGFSYDISKQALAETQVIDA